MIDFLRLANFKAFDDVEIPLGGLTLLSGLNGSGKSTVLQAIGILRQSFDEKFLNTGELALNGELVSIGTGKDALYQGFGSPEIEIALAETQTDKTIECSWKTTPSSEQDVLTCSAYPHYDILPHLGVFSEGFQYLRVFPVSDCETDRRNCLRRISGSS